MCGMYGLTAKLSVATLNICQILMTIKRMSENRTTEIRRSQGPGVFPLITTGLDHRSVHYVLAWQRL
jgi:hypothetical protein